MSRFTKGTWEVVGTGGVWIIDREKKKYQVICDCEHGEITEEHIIEINANAHLIAAAPELYELVMDELRGEAGGILSFAREAKIREVISRIDGKEAENHDVSC